VKKTKKADTIELFIADGEFDTSDIGCVKQLLNDAGAKLDHAYAADITGCPIFKAADGKWYTGSVEFTVYPANLENVVDVLADGEHCECQNCGHIDQRGDLTEVEDHAERVAAGEENPAGECTKCSACSHLITKARAMEIAGITKKKPARRRGGLK
jgi:hypothetical protein